MPRWFLLPGQNYTGPFNSISREYRKRYKPVDRLDKASLKHDLAYNAYRNRGYNPYFRFNYADAEYLRRVQRIPGWRARVAGSVFRVKRFLTT